MIAYNPAAGRYPSRLLVERAARVFEARGWEVQLEQTHSSIHITQLAHLAAHQNFDYFFISGGDGSLNRAVAGLVDTPTVLGVLPAGTANVWAQELGLPGLTWTRLMALEESARRLAGGSVHQVDVGYCNDQPFLLWAGVGLDGIIVHHLEPRSRWEKHFAVVQYAATAVWQAAFWHGMNLRVEADGQQILGHFLLSLVSNVHLYAGGIAELSPHARLDDGKMDLWLFEGETLGDVAQLAWELLAGSHVNSNKVLQIRFTQLWLEADTNAYVQLDGEPAAGGESVSISVHPRSLRVLVPERTPRVLFSHDP
jgi:YegS/Rv2252/BmrU family lipid kinase